MKITLPEQTHTYDADGKLIYEPDPITRRKTLEEVEAVVQRRIKQEQDWTNSYNGKAHYDKVARSNSIGVLLYIPMEYILQLIKDMPRENK